MRRQERSGRQDKVEKRGEERKERVVNGSEKAFAFSMDKEWKK